MHKHLPNLLSCFLPCQGPTETQNAWSTFWARHQPNTSNTAGCVCIVSPLGASLLTSPVASPILCSVPAEAATALPQKSEGQQGVQVTHADLTQPSLFIAKCKPNLRDALCLREDNTDRIEVILLLFFFFKFKKLWHEHKTVLQSNFLRILLA